MLQYIFVKVVIICKCTSNQLTIFYTMIIYTHRYLLEFAFHVNCTIIQHFLHSIVSLKRIQLDILLISPYTYARNPDDQIPNICHHTHSPKTFTTQVILESCTIQTIPSCIRTSTIEVHSQQYEMKWNIFLCGQCLKSKRICTKFRQLWRKKIEECLLNNCTLRAYYLLILRIMNIRLFHAVQVSS